MHRLNALQITAFPEKEKTTAKKKKKKEAQNVPRFALIACLPASCQGQREETHCKRPIGRL